MATDMVGETKDTEAPVPAKRSRSSKAAAAKPASGETPAESPPAAPETGTEAPGKGEVDEGTSEPQAPPEPEASTPARGTIGKADYEAVREAMTAEGATTVAAAIRQRAEETGRTPNAVAENYYRNKKKIEGRTPTRTPSTPSTPATRRRQPARNGSTGDLDALIKSFEESYAALMAGVMKAKADVASIRRVLDH